MHEQQEENGDQEKKKCQNRILLKFKLKINM